MKEIIMPAKFPVFDVAEYLDSEEIV